MIEKYSDAVEEMMLREFRRHMDIIDFYEVGR